MYNQSDLVPINRVNDYYLFSLYIKHLTNDANNLMSNYCINLSIQTVRNKMRSCQFNSGHVSSTGAMSVQQGPCQFNSVHVSPTATMSVQQRPCQFNSGHVSSTLSYIPISGYVRLYYKLTHSSISHTTETLIKCKR